MSLHCNLQLAAVRNGPILRLCIAYALEVQSCLEAYKKFMDKYGATDCRLHPTTQPTWFAFPSKRDEIVKGVRSGPPANWTQTNNGYSQPYKNNKEAWNEILSLPIYPSATDMVYDEIPKNTSFGRIPLSFRFKRSAKAKWEWAEFTRRRGYREARIIQSVGDDFWMEVPDIHHMLRMAAIEHPSWVFEDAVTQWRMPTSLYIVSESDVDYRLALAEEAKRAMKKAA